MAEAVKRSSCQKLTHVVEMYWHSPWHSVPVSPQLHSWSEAAPSCQSNKVHSSETSSFPCEFEAQILQRCCASWGVMELFCMRIACSVLEWVVLEWAISLKEWSLLMRMPQPWCLETTWQCVGISTWLTQLFLLQTLSYHSFCPKLGTLLWGNSVFAVCSPVMTEVLEYIKNIHWNWRIWWSIFCYFLKFL